VQFHRWTEWPCTVPQVHAPLLGVNLGAESPNSDALNPNPPCAWGTGSKRSSNLCPENQSKPWIGGASGGLVCVERTLLSAAFDL